MDITMVNQGQFFYAFGRKIIQCCITGILKSDFDILRLCTLNYKFSYIKLQ